MSKVRKNLSISIDERGGSGESEVMKIVTTSTDLVTLYFAIPEKVTVHPDDLQTALDQIKVFLKDRPAQPKVVTPITLEELNHKRIKSENLEFSAE